MCKVVANYPGLIKVEIPHESFKKTCLHSLAFVGQKMKLAKVTGLEEVDSNEFVAWLQPLESQFEIILGDEVHFLKLEDVVSLQPNFFGQSIDLLGKIISPKPNIEDIYDFIPVVQNSQKVNFLQKLGYIQLQEKLKYWALSNTAGTVDNISVGKYSFSDTFCKVSGREQNVHLFVDTQDLTFEKKRLNNLITKVGVIDLLFPILLGTHNLLNLPPKSLFASILDSQSIDFVIILNSSYSNKSHPLSHNVVELIDIYEDPILLLQASQILANQILAMGYKVLIWNNLESAIGFVWSFGEGKNADDEQYSLTIIDTFNQYQRYDNYLTFDNNKIDIEKTYLQIDIQNFLLEKGNIQYLTDFKLFHQKVKSSKEIQKLLSLDFGINQDSLHNLLNS
jgi:hypothetical protein